MKISFPVTLTDNNFAKQSLCQRWKKGYMRPCSRAEDLQVSLQAALTGLSRLEDDGVLKVLTKTQRRKKWVAHEVLTKMKRPHGQHPQEALDEAR